jgi:hypothetical protein
LTTTALKKLTGFFHFLRSDQDVEQKLAEQDAKREQITKRVEAVTRATLNGETDWFLEIVRSDPTCALKVIKECDNE